MGKNHLAVGMGRGKVHLIEAELMHYEENLMSHTFDNHKDQVWDIQFVVVEGKTVDAELMVSSSYDGSIAVVSLLEFQTILRLNLNNKNSEIRQMIIIPEEDMMLLKINSTSKVVEVHLDFTSMDEDLRNSQVNYYIMDHCL